MKNRRAKKRAQARHIRTSKRGRKFVAGKGSQTKKQHGKSSVKDISPDHHKIYPTSPSGQPSTEEFSFSGPEYSNQYEKIKKALK